jgi:hypothetical protein
MTGQYAKFSPDHLGGVIQAIDAYFKDLGIATMVNPELRVSYPGSSCATLWKFGGANRDRTGDLYNAIVALSQLSYGPALLVTWRRT